MGQGMFVEGEDAGMKGGVPQQGLGAGQAHGNPEVGTGQRAVSSEQGLHLICLKRGP